jgi:hypothetical protein
VTVLGVDISEWQPNWTPEPATSFVMVKASKGSASGNPLHDAQVAKARPRIVGHYHWLYPLAISPLADQLANFAARAKPTPGDPLAIDWENPATQGLVPIADLEAFTRAVMAKFPQNRVIVYTYPFYEPFHASGGHVFLGHGLWIADYRSSAPADIFNLPWVMHQYTDKPYDHDRANFAGVADMVKWLTWYLPQPPQPPEPPMTTKAPPNLYKLYTVVKPGFSSMQKGGVVGDLRHVAGGGYHISRNDLRAHGQGGDYSIQAPADKRGDGNFATAINITLSKPQMVEMSKRLKAAFDRDDPRIDCLREFIGTVDNRNVCGWNRYRTGRRTGWYASGYSETSHLSHVHLSFFRAYSNDWNRMLGVAEVVRGLPAGKLGWRGSSPIPPKPPTPTPTRPTVSLSALVRAAKADPGRPQGGTTPGSADDVKVVERALKAEGLLASQFAGDGSYGTSTKVAYTAWQRRCGYSGKDADGIPGKVSLTKLGNKRGFRVGN